MHAHTCVGVLLLLLQVAALESELSCLKREEADRSMALRDLGSQRDRIALSIAQKLSKVKDVQVGLGWGWVWGVMSFDWLGCDCIYWRGPLPSRQQLSRV